MILKVAFMEYEKERGFQITFMPGGVTATAAPGSSAADAAAAAGVRIGRHCGGAGVCGKCRVAVKDRDEDPFGPLTETEKKLLTQEEIEGGLRLSCCAPIV